jgi:hypothetical protein
MAFIVVIILSVAICGVVGLSIYSMNTNRA